MIEAVKPKPVTTVKHSTDSQQDPQVSQLPITFEMKWTW
jgi:hypothetical protein